jgi:hypothetical protein
MKNVKRSNRRSNLLHTKSRVKSRVSEQNAGREDNDWRPKATGEGVPRLTIDAAVGIVDYAHITPQEGEVIMGQSGNSRHGGGGFNQPLLLGGF